ncbi:MAG: TSUP family transporter [Beijerinckiaceae bacterium]
MLQSLLADTGITLPMLLLMMALAFLTAVFHSVSGLAGALFLVILLTPMLGLKTAVPIVAVAVAISNVTRLWVFHKELNIPIFRAIMLTSLPAMFLGAVLFVYMSATVISVCFGLFLLLSIPGRRYFETRGYKAGPREFMMIGPVYGIVSGVTMGAGLLLAPFFLGAGLRRGEIGAMTAAIGIVLNITKTVVFGASPLLTGPLFLIGAILGICTMPGAYAGRWILQRTSIRVHTFLVEGIMIAGALFFLYRAITGATN